MKLIFTLLLLLSLLTACSTLHKRADQHYLAGEYIAAASLYEQILARDGKDALAKERLQKSREHLIQIRLIEVRKQRLADNYFDALSKLAQIQNDEAKWNVSPLGASFSTQLEETEALYRWVDQQVRSAVNSGKFLKGKIIVDRYKSVFEGGTTRKKQDSLFQFVHLHGGKHCEQLKKISDGYYSREFVTRYCMVWGQNESNASRDFAKGAVADAFGSVKLAGAIESMPGEQLINLTDAMLAGLKSTPYFKSGADPLLIQLRGKFSTKYSERLDEKIHYYEVDEPYTQTESVAYTEQVPYTEYRSECKGLSEVCQRVAHTSYRSETKHKLVDKTYYRKVTRSLRYNTVEFELEHRLTGKSAFAIGGVAFEIPLDNELALTDYFHDTEHAAAGLRPRPRKAPTPSEWLQTKFKEVTPMMTGKIADTWDSRYCKTPADLTERTQIETIMRCLKGSRRSHDFVENWFQSRFGLTYEDVKRAIGIQG